MKEKPMLYAGPMVRALLEDRKTQTRRMIKPQPFLSDRNPPRFTDTEKGDIFIAPDLFPSSGMSSAGGPSDSVVFCIAMSRGSFRCLGKQDFCEQYAPHPVGSRIWAKETFKTVPVGNHVVYRADNPLNHADEVDRAFGPWKPSIFMPRWASRITLEVTAVRVERLNDISEADALAEGITWPDVDGKPYRPPIDLTGMSDLRLAAKCYAELWESINGRGSWAKNPMVWVYEFKRV